MPGPYPRADEPHRPYLTTTEGTYSTTAMVHFAADLAVHLNVCGATEEATADAARAAVAALMNVARERRTFPELPEDVAGPGDVPNAHGVAWQASWKRGGGESHRPCKSFAHARAWLVQAAERHEDTPPTEEAIPLSPDGLLGWSWEAASGAKYSLRRQRA